MLVLGTITGLTYGLFAIGLILAYRSSGVINFALGNVGGVAAAIMGRLTLTLGLPWLIVFPIALVAGGLTAAGLEIGVMRRLRNAPRMMAIVATLGAAQLLLGISGSITQLRNTALFPPPFDLSFRVGSLAVTPYYVLILILSPVLLLLLVLFLSPPEWLPKPLRSRYGPAIRAAADNPDAARTAGIPTGAMSAMAWAISGVLAAFAAALLAPARGFQTIDALGPDLLLRALAPAVIASMARLPIALAAGVGVGAFEQVMLWNYRSTWPVEMGLFVVILVGLLLQRRGGEVSADQSWLALPREPPLDEQLNQIWSIRNLNRVVAGAALVLALSLPLAITNERAAVFVAIFTLATIGLSITVITGSAGQVSLGQFAVAGFGALTAYWIYVRMDIPWALSILAAAIAGSAASFIIGLPALRLRGLMLAVSSLGFAVMAPPVIFGSEWAFGTGIDPGRPIILSRELVTVRAYYYVALAALLVCSVLVVNLRRGGIGRILSAIRDNEDVARAFGIRTTPRKLQAFAVSGLIAGLGGAVLAQSLSRLNIETFSADRSVSLLAMVVLGGISKVSGSIIGALYLVGLPLLIPIDTVQLLVTGVGVLVLVLYVPGGLGQLLEVVRQVAIKRMAALDVRAERDHSDDVASQTEPRFGTLDRGKTGEVLLGWRPGEHGRLVADRLVVSYGEVKALDDVSIEIRGGEILGVMGPNGSGKTTLFKVLSGFVKPDSGTVHLDEADVSHMSPEGRARLGLVRSFQDSMLFPTLTVLDTVRLALEKASDSHVVASVLNLPSSGAGERSKDKTARELVNLLGLWPFRNKFVGELSTGTRRITEICCLIALEPRVLLLDEPSSGIAQKETEALAELLLSLKSQLDTTLCVIEHDMPLLMGVSNRVVALSAGRKIAEGSPAEIQKDPQVIDTYLGVEPSVGVANPR